MSHHGIRLTDEQLVGLTRELERTTADPTEAKAIVDLAVVGAIGEPASCPGCLDGGDGQGHSQCWGGTKTQMLLYHAGLIAPELGGRYGVGWHWNY